MWAETRKHGKVKFIERYTDPMTGETKKVSVTMDKDNRSTRKEASKILDQKIDAILNKSYCVVKDNKFTLQDLVDAYRAEQQKTVKQSTYRRNYFTANAMLDVLGKNTLVEKLNANYIRDRMYSLDRPNASINEFMKRCKGILRWGYKNDYLSDISFLDKISPLPDSSYREKIEDKFLEVEEFRALVFCMKVHVWQLFTKFLAFSGMRIGEAIALEKEDVDFRNRIIRINKTYDPNNGITTTAKTMSSTREIYMQDELLEVCTRIDVYMKRQSLTCGYPHGPLFLQNEKGGNIQYYAYNKYLKENALAALGREKVTPHILRHTHVCMLAENGVHLETISRRLGHEDSDITKAVYYHITEKMKQNDYDQVAKIRIL